MATTLADAVGAARLRRIHESTGLEGMDLLWRTILDERLDATPGLDTAPSAVLNVRAASASPALRSPDLASPTLFSHAQIATWAGWSARLGSSDFMASARSAADAAAALALVPQGSCPPELPTLVSALASPGYYGIASAETGRDLVRLYVGREDGLALHVLFEPEPSGSFVLADPDDDGVPTAYAPLVVMHVRHAVHEIAQHTGADVTSGPTGTGTAWRLSWS